MKKPLIFITLFIASLFIGCTDEQLTVVAPFTSWQQTQYGTPWHYAYAENSIWTIGKNQTQIISNPIAHNAGDYTISVTINNQSVGNDVRVIVYGTFKGRSEGQTTIHPLTGKVTYNVNISLHEPAKIGFRVIGSNFNLDVKNVSVY